MRKTRKNAVVAILLGTVGFLGAGTAYAHGGHGHGHERKGRETKTIVMNQSTTCSTEDENTDVQGESGFENGMQGNKSHGKGSPGTQSTNVGSTLGCDNTIVLGK
ncbi:hypothetical protein AB0L75_08915 [Streptomyces sp. NPDC052101]|uniref:hypothetical protein n=1 Tax=Streptomyces sp. NPDC052101 TaxID=3155763 RepID=UPI00343CA0E0